MVISLIVCLVSAGLLIGSVYAVDIVGETGKQILAVVGGIGTLGGLFTFLFSAKQLADRFLS